MPPLVVPTIFIAVDKLSSVMSKMQGNVSKFASETQKKYAQMSRSAQEWQTNFSQIGMAAGIAGAAIVAPLALATKAAADFEDQMATVGTTVGKGNVPLLSKGVLETLKHTTAPLQELTDGLYKITSAGIPAANAIKVLNESAQLALIGRGSVPEAADALTSAMNVFKDEGLSSGKIMSMLFQTIATGKTTIAEMSESFGATANIIHNGGVSLTDFLAATKAMTIMGEPASQAMNQIRASVFGLEKPTKGMRYLFHELGVKDIHQLIRKFGDLGGAMQAIETMGAKHHVIMAKAWGKVGSYAAVINLTSPTGKASYKQGQLDMAKSEQAAAEAYALKMQTLAAQLKLVHNNMQAFSIVLGTQLIPVLTKILPKISAFVDGLANLIERNPMLAKYIIVITGAIGALLLVIAPLAFAISGVMGLMKLWAGYQLLVAERAAIAAGAIATEGATVTGIAGEFAVAEVAATGFFATLSAFVIPAALVALGGLAIWKILQGLEKAPSAPKYFHRGKPGDSDNQFFDPKEEAAWLKWFPANPVKTNNPMIFNSPERSTFDSIYRKNNNVSEDMKPLLDSLASSKHFGERRIDSTQFGRIDLHINDPGGHVDSTKTNTPINIPVTLHQKSTTGNK